MITGNVETEETHMKLDFVEPKAVEFTTDSFQKITFINKKTGDRFYDVDIKLMFPLTDKKGFIAVFHEGDEIALIRDYRLLEKDSKGIVKEALDIRYFIPEIKRINKVVREYRLVHWFVETNKGELDFYTRTRHDIVVKDKKVYIKDIDANRYFIKDYTALSPQSQKELNSEI